MGLSVQWPALQRDALAGSCIQVPLSAAMSRRRAVITGLGLVTPLGTGVEPTWAGAIAGKSGVGPITRFDPGKLKTRIAGEVKDFDPLHWMDRREARRTDRYVQLAMAAAEMAVRSSGLQIGTGPEQIRPERVGVIVGSGIGGLASAEEAHEKALRVGFDRLSPMFVLELLSNTAAGMISIRYGAAGSVEAALTVLTLCRGVIPPTINQRVPDPDCDLDYVPNVARERRVDTALSLSFGFGGTNAVLAFASPGREGCQ